MVRYLAAVVLGSIVVFIWGMAARMFLPIHEGTIKSMEPDREKTFVEFLKKQDLEAAWYVIPGLADEDESTSEEQKKKNMDDFIERHRRGPLVSIIYSPEGREPMSPRDFAQGFAVDLISALLAAILLSSATCCRNYFARVGFLGCVGLFTAVFTYGNLWNWMRFPTHFTLTMLADVTIAWLLAGIVMAIFIRPPAPKAEA